MAGNTTDKIKDTVNRAKDAMPDDVNADFETLREDFTRLRADVQTLMKDTAALGRHGGQHVADTAWKQGEHLADKVRDGATRAEECVTEHPFAALGVAVGVGLLAGMMLRR